ncbi:MAG: crossover junction endodeoxyribonuclease RuvC [Rhodospirillaceae bacterium]|nr:crossover junction endodeoxyribonuclease RuvC [Rhodospirillaceae bacterium]
MRSWPSSRARAPSQGEPTVRILGLDPGLRRTGWGVIDTAGNRLSFVAAGAIAPGIEGALSDRLHRLFVAVRAVIDRYGPHECAIEDTFVNKNPTSTLKLGHARAAAMLAPAEASLMVCEYKPNLVKKSVVGAGHADKDQVGAMVRMLLPGAAADTADAADALAVAICHAHHRTTAQRMLVAAR